MFLRWTLNQFEIESENIVNSIKELFQCPSGYVRLGSQRIHPACRQGRLNLTVIYEEINEYSNYLDSLKLFDTCIIQALFFIIHVLTSGKIVDYICKVSSIKTKVVHGKHKQNSKHVIYISFGFFFFGLSSISCNITGYILPRRLIIKLNYYSYRSCVTATLQNVY